MLNPLDSFKLTLESTDLHQNAINFCSFSTSVLHFTQAASSETSPTKLNDERPFPQAQTAHSPALQPCCHPKDGSRKKVPVNSLRTKTGGIITPLSVILIHSFTHSSIQTTHPPTLLVPLANSTVECEGQKNEMRGKLNGEDLLSALCSTKPELTDQKLS